MSAATEAVRVDRLVRAALVHPPAERVCAMCGERAHAEPVDLAVADLVLHPRPDHDAVAPVGRDEPREEVAGAAAKPVVGRRRSGRSRRRAPSISCAQSTASARSRSSLLAK